MKSFTATLVILPFLAVFLNCNQVMQPNYLPNYSSEAITVWARDWKDGYRGVKWDSDCDFNGNDISCFENLVPNSCLDRCFDHGDCSHWTYRNDGFCCIKKANQMIESDSPGHNCGFILGRSSQSSK